MKRAYALIEVNVKKCCESFPEREREETVGKIPFVVKLHLSYCLCMNDNE